MCSVYSRYSPRDDEWAVVVVPSQSPIASSPKCGSSASLVSVCVCSASDDDVDHDDDDGSALWFKSKLNGMKFISVPTQSAYIHGMLIPNAAADLAQLQPESEWGKASVRIVWHSINLGGHSLGRPTDCPHLLRNTKQMHQFKYKAMCNGFFGDGKGHDQQLAKVSIPFIWPIQCALIP